MSCLDGTNHETTVLNKAKAASIAGKSANTVKQKDIHDVMPDICKRA